jgi:hypothetical protein
MHSLVRLTVAAPDGSGWDLQPSAQNPKDHYVLRHPSAHAHPQKEVCVCVCVSVCLRVRVRVCVT